MRRPLLVTAWLLVVVACSTAVWAVIGSAGRGVTSSHTGIGPVPSATPGPTGPSTSPPPPTAPSAPRSPSTAGSGQEQSTSPSRPARAPATRDVPRPPRPQPAAEVRRTWTSPAGSVVVACRGATISFRGAQANSGWGVDVRERGPEEVDVRFESSGDAEDVGVESSCVGGQPRFSD